MYKSVSIINRYLCPCMKKAAILCITAFYLLLTTGMFVCLVHCAAENFIAGPEMATAMPMNHHGMSCCKQSKRDCSKTHGNYIVKENIKPSTVLQFTQTTLPAPQLQLGDLIVAATFAQVTLPQQTKAPPDKSGRAIIIQNHSFLI